MGDWERGRIKMMDTEKKKKKIAQHCTVIQCWRYSHDIQLFTGSLVTCVLQEEIEVGEVRLKRSAELKADEKRVEEVMQKISESK